MERKLKTVQVMAIVIIQLMLITPLASAVLIQGVDVEVSGNSAVITWTTTDPTTTTINYGDTTLKENSVSDTNLLEEHTMEIVGLSPETKYYYDIVAEDANSSSTEYSSNFITADITSPPKVSGILNGTITETSIELLWAHVNVVDFNHYNIFRDGVNIHNATSISHVDDGLIAGMSYTYTISAVDDSGNMGESSDPFTVSTLAPDITGPAVFNISILALTDSTAVIGWNTDEESNSIINYGTSESSLGLSVTDLALVIEHSLTMIGLTKDIRYVYVVQSCDEAGNCDNSEPLAFTAGADYTPPFINATIPEYYNGLEIDFDVFTENHSDVLVYVNDIYRRSGNSGSEGKVSFRNVDLDSVLGTNVIRIEAVDQIGNEAVQNYNLELDFVAPVMDITTNVTNLTTERSITIQGNVDELSTIRFFLELDPFDTTPPEKVTELVAVNVETNNVELEWKKSIAEDFNYYLIYREDIGLIATSTRENYKDENVNSGITYNYWVIAVDNDCIKGGGSDVIAVRTQEGEEAIVELDVEQVVAECDITSPEVELETSGYFSEKINLRKGINKIKVEASDKAGNAVVWEVQTIHDTDAPKFVSDNIDALNPSYSEYVTIKGQVDEPSTVYVYLNERVVPDHFTQTDNQGNFAVEVQLRKDEEIGRAGELKWRNELTLMAVDIAGLNGTIDGRIDFSRCGGGNMDWIVNTRDLYPDSLVPRLLLEGMGQFTLGVDLEWQGAGAEPERFNAIPRIEKLDLSIEEKVNYDEEYLRSRVLMPDRKDRTLTVLVDINALPDPTPAGENWTSYDKEDNISKMHAGECFGSSTLSNVGVDVMEGVGCIKAPLELILKYKCEEYDSHGYLRNETCIQKECIFVDMLIEPRIDPSKMFNKDLLGAMVGFLNGSIEAINAVLESLETVSRITMAGCAVGWALLTVKKVSEFKACYVSTSFKDLIANLQLEEICESCNVVDGSVICPISDDDIKNKCESCMGAKLNTLKFERGMHAVCDRVFCPSVPSYESYIEKNTSKVCENHVPNYNVDLIKSKESKVFSNTDCDMCEILPEGTWCKDHKSECCAVDYMNQWSTGALFMDEMKESACIAAGNAADVKEGLGCNKWGDFIRGARNFKLCKGGITEEIAVGSGDYTLILNKTGEGDLAIWGMHLARDFEYTMTIGGIQETKSERIMIRDLSGLLREIEEIKCEGIKKGDIKYNSLDWPTYEVGGSIERTEVERRAGTDSAIITNITTLPEQQKVPIPVVNFICEDFEVKEDNIIDPASGLLKATQAVCLPGVNSYLKQTKQIMELFQGCFNTILVTGDGSSGMCQHLVSQYICDLIYYAISCVKQLVPQGDGIRAEGGIVGFGKHILSSVKNVQSGISGRYGNSRNFQAFFTGKKLVHSVCMAMFGADIDFNFDSLLDMGVDIPTDPFIMASGTRRFVGYDVTTGWSSHLYNIAPVIIAGEDMKYWIELVCSNDFSCEPSDGFEGGKCDCAEEALNCRVDGCTRGVTRIFGSGRLAKGEVLNTEEFISVEPPHRDSKYRFDKVRIRYESMLGQDARAGEEHSRRGDTKEFNIRPIGGNSPVHCYFRWGATDPGFRCDFYMDERGTAVFTNPRGESVKNISDVYYLGERIMNNSQLSYVFKTEGKDDNGDPIPIYLVGELKNQNGAVVQQESIPITEEGYHDYNMNNDAFNGAFVVRPEFFTQTASVGTGSTTNADGTISGSGCDGIESRFGVDSLSCDGISGTDVRVVYYEGSDIWKVYSNIAGSPLTPTGKIENYMCAPYVDSEKIVKCNLTDSSGDVTESITIYIPTWEKTVGDYIKIISKSNSSSGGNVPGAPAIPGASSGNVDCTTTAVPWTLTLSLYPSDDFGDIDMGTPFELNEKEQKITFNIKAKCINEGEEVPITSPPIGGDISGGNGDTPGGSNGDGSGSGSSNGDGETTEESGNCTFRSCEGVNTVGCNCGGNLTTNNTKYCFEGEHNTGNHIFGNREECLCGNYEVDSGEICDFDGEGNVINNSNLNIQMPDSGQLNGGYTNIFFNGVSSRLFFVRTINAKVSGWCDDYSYLYSKNEINNINEDVSNLILSEDNCIEGNLLNNSRNFCKNQCTEYWPAIAVRDSTGNIGGGVIFHPYGLKMNKTNPLNEQYELGIKMWDKNEWKYESDIEFENRYKKTFNFNTPSTKSGEEYICEWHNSDDGTCTASNTAEEYYFVYNK